MRDWIFRLRVLARMLADTYGEWKAQFVGRDLDGYYCCAGQMLDECGCHGSTVREVAEWSVLRAK